jgi:hypothetical protein
LVLTVVGYAAGPTVNRPMTITENNCEKAILKLKLNFSDENDSKLNIFLQNLRNHLPTQPRVCPPPNVPKSFYFIYFLGIYS